MTEPATHAPGWPGIAPRWTWSAKQGVGTSASPVSHAWCRWEGADFAVVVEGDGA